MTGISASLIAPFLALYIDGLGDFNKQQLSLFTGIVFASTYIVMQLFHLYGEN